MEPLLTRELGIFGRYFLYKYCNVFILSKLEVTSLDDKKGLFQYFYKEVTVIDTQGKEEDLIKYLFSNDSSDKIVVREYFERKLFCFSRVLCLLSHHLQDLLTSVRAVLRLKRIRPQIKTDDKKNVLLVTTLQKKLESHNKKYRRRRN